MVERYINRNISDAHAGMIVNVAVNTIWNRYDWREALAQFPPFYLVPLEQDYGAPAAIVPPDFLGLREVFWVQRSTPPNREIVHVKRDLQLTHMCGLPQDISYEASLNKFRLFPRTPDGIGATDYLIEGTYKKRPVKLTNDILSNTLIPWDDIYISTVTQALKWAALDTAGDPRAGTCKFQNGQAMYDGQMAIMFDSIDAMAIHEGLNLGDTVRAPDEALVGSTNFGGGIIGIGL